MIKTNKSLFRNILIIGIFTLLFFKTNTAMAAENKSIIDGVYEIRTKLNTGYILDVAGPSLDNYATLQLWEDVDVENQRFEITSDGFGYYTITSVYSGKVLDTDGNDIFQNGANGSDTQKWDIKPSNSGGYYYIVNKGTLLYADVDNAYADCGTNVKMFVLNDGYGAQEWSFSLLHTIEKGYGYLEDSKFEAEIPTFETSADKSEALSNESSSPSYDKIKQPKPEKKTYTIEVAGSVEVKVGTSIMEIGRFDAYKVTNDQIVALEPEFYDDEHEFYGYYSMDGCDTYDEAVKRGIILNSIPAGNEKDIKLYYELRLKNKPASSPAVTPQPSVEPKQNIVTESSDQGLIDIVLKEIPIGTKWNGNSSYKGTYGCFAFAKKAFNIMYGVDCASAYSGSRKYNYGTPTNLILVSRLAETKNSVKSSEVKDALICAQTGDILQVGRYKSSEAKTTTPHTMVLECVSDNGITVIHGNYNGKVARTYFTWESFKKNYLKNPNDKTGVGVSVYRYKK